MKSTKKVGRYGPYGGQYVPETLIPALHELEMALKEALEDSAFLQEYEGLLKTYVGRPSLLYEAHNLRKRLGGPRIFLKREDLNHTGAHKINNALGQVLLAKRMGKTAIIAETGAGQHGVATATACALLGLTCKVYMGEVDVARQRLNVYRMQLLGAEVCPVKSGSRTLKDACNEALRAWISEIETTHYVLGSALGPHPYPAMVKAFQDVIGMEARMQILLQAGRLPDAVMACVGGGSNAIGMFNAFTEDSSVRLVAAEAAGRGLDTPYHAASLQKGTYGVLHGAAMPILQDENGQIIEAHSISAGLDYPGVSPELSHLKAKGRLECMSATDEEAIHGFCLLAETEGIIPALESAHAIAAAVQLCPTLSEDSILLICLSGRGDKDVEQVLSIEGGTTHE